MLKRMVVAVFAITALLTGRDGCVSIGTVQAAETEVDVNALKADSIELINTYLEDLKREEGTIKEKKGKKGLFGKLRLQKEDKTAVSRLKYLRSLYNDVFKTYQAGKYGNVNKLNGKATEAIRKGKGIGEYLSKVSTFIKLSAAAEGDKSAKGLSAIYVKLAAAEKQKNTNYSGDWATLFQKLGESLTCAFPVPKGVQTVQ